MNTSDQIKKRITDFKQKNNRNPSDLETSEIMLRVIAIEFDCKKSCKKLTTGSEHD